MSFLYVLGSEHTLGNHIFLCFSSIHLLKAMLFHCSPLYMVTHRLLIEARDMIHIAWAKHTYKGLVLFIEFLFHCVKINEKNLKWIHQWRIWCFTIKAFPWEKHLDHLPLKCTAGSNHIWIRFYDHLLSSWEGLLTCWETNKQKTIKDYCLYRKERW